jgi:hypothetical protein
MIALKGNRGDFAAGAGHGFRQFAVILTSPASRTNYE